MFTCPITGPHISRHYFFSEIGHSLYLSFWLHFMILTKIPCPVTCRVTYHHVPDWQHLLLSLHPLWHVHLTWAPEIYTSPKSSSISSSWSSLFTTYLINFTASAAALTLLLCTAHVLCSAIREIPPFLYFPDQANSYLHRSQDSDNHARLHEAPYLHRLY